MPSVAIPSSYGTCSAAQGYQSDIYYGNASPDRLEFGYPVSRLGEHSASGRVLLYQLSIGSGVADIFRERGERKFVNYHNITPADLLEAWMPEVGEEVRWGRAQLRDLAPVTEFAIADSGFNERELRSAGYRSTATVPLLIDLDSFSGSPDPVLAGRLAEAESTGWHRPALRGQGLAPQGPGRSDQGPGHLPPALRSPGPPAHRGRIDQRRVLGGPRAVRRGARADRRRGVRRVVTHEELIAYYAAADVFCCLSNHEGFCVPLLESMYHRLPIVAYTNTAVPETVQGAGLVLPDKEPARVAAAIDRVVGDDRLREVLAAAAAERVETFALPRVREGFATALGAACAV